MTFLSFLIIFNCQRQEKGYCYPKSICRKQLALAKTVWFKLPSNLVPADMVKETVVHVQTTTRFVFQIMPSFVS